MRYVMARLKQEERELAYRIYVSECVRLIPQNKWLTHPFSELVFGSSMTEEDGQRIVDDVVTRAGLEIV